MLAAIFAAALLAAPASRPAADYGWTYDPLYRATTGWDDGWLATVRDAPPGLFQVRPVAGVGIDPTPDRHDNFGSATAAVVPHAGGLHGQRIVVATFVGRYHWRAPKTPDDLPKDQGDGSTAFIKYSDDGGHTWSEGVKLDKTGRFPPQTGDARPKVFMKAIGADADGRLYLAAGRGVGLLYSDDGGDSWERHDGVLSESQVGGESFGLGSRLLDHPSGGLMMFGHHGGKTIEPVLHVLHSTDRGETWHRTTLPTGDAAVQPVEPTALMYGDGEVLLFGRNGPNGREHRPFQLRLKVNGPGDYEVLDARLTNIDATQNPDTHEIILNPKNDRFEAVVHNRGGRAPGVNDEGMSTTLWSIDRNELESGSARWRYDGALNVMQGDYGPAIRPNAAFDLDLWQDGSHPAAGALIDEDGDGTADRQQIFVQMAASTDSFAHVYVIDRTLDSDALREYLLPRSPTPFDPRKAVEVAQIEGEPDWDEIEAVSLRQFIGLSRDPNEQAADLSAHYKVAANDDGVLVRVEVRDDVVRPDAADIYEGDSVEIYLSRQAPDDCEEPQRPGAYPPTAEQFTFAASADGQVKAEKHGDAAGVTRDFRRTADGYAVDLFVPWSLVGGPPEGGRFGFDIQLNDRDAADRRARKAAWHAADGDSWQSPRKLGAAVLSQ